MNQYPSEISDFSLGKKVLNLHGFDYPAVCVSRTVERFEAGFILRWGFFCRKFIGFLKLAALCSSTF